MDGDIQLVDREAQWKGRLEIRFNQRWGTVSGEGWDSTETEVVCRELGYQPTGMYCVKCDSLSYTLDTGCVYMPQEIICNSISCDEYVQ